MTEPKMPEAESLPAQQSPFIVAAPRTGVSCRVTPTILEGYVTAKGLMRLFAANGGVPAELTELAKKARRYLLTTANYNGTLVRLAVELTTKPPTGLVQNAGCISDVTVSRALAETVLAKPVEQKVVVLGTEERTETGERELTLAWESHTYTSQELLNLLLNSPTTTEPLDALTIRTHAPSIYGPASKIAVFDGAQQLVLAALRRHTGLIHTEDLATDCERLRVVVMTSRNNSIVFSVNTAEAIPPAFVAIDPTSAVFHNPDPLLQQDVYTLFELVRGTTGSGFWIDLDSTAWGWCQPEHLMTVLLNKIKPNLAAAEQCRELAGFPAPKLEEKKMEPSKQTAKPKAKKLPVPKPKSEIQGQNLNPEADTKNQWQHQDNPGPLGVLGEPGCVVKTDLAGVVSHVDATDAVPLEMSPFATIEPHTPLDALQQGALLPAPELLTWASVAEPESTSASQPVGEDTVTLTVQEYNVYKMLKGNTRKLRTAARLAQKVRKDAMRAAFAEMLSALATYGYADLPAWPGLSESSMQTVIELLAEDAGVVLHIHKGTVTV